MERDKIRKFMQEKGYNCFVPHNASAGEWFQNHDVTLNMKLIKDIVKEAQKERDKLWIEKFDKYSCIKNDKWYLTWKKEIKND